MIQGNESLLQAVTHALHLLEHQLKQHHITQFAKDWAHLITLIQHAHHAVVDGSGVDKKAIVKAMMAITNKIDEEIIALEQEMHGVLNFASVSGARLEEVSIKQQVKEELYRLVRMVASARIQTKHRDLTDVLNLLKPESEAFQSDG